MDGRGGEYRTSIDRIGLALGCGAALAGVAAALLVVLGGDGSMRAILLALSIGTTFAGIAIAAVGGPVWLALNAAGQTGPVAAAGAGAAIGFALMFAAELGRDGEPWPHALGAALLAAALAGGIALAMWRVAYRDRDR